MTEKEAIEELKSYAENSWGGLNEAFEKAIEALEKQAPKKLKIVDEYYKNGRFEKEYECCECGNPYVENSYCSYCGQAIDWSEV